MKMLLATSVMGRLTNWMDVEALRAMTVSGTGRTVAEEVNQAISVIGENLSLRRTAYVEVQHGVVAGYLHNQLAPGLGKLGVLVALSFALGVLMDAVGPTRYVNLLAFPLLGLIAWNLLVYVGILVHGLTDPFRSARPKKGVVWRAVARLGGALHEGAGDAGQGTPGTRFRTEWARVSAPLTARRVGRVLHLAAMAFALGAIAALYTRGLVLHFQAGSGRLALRVAGDLPGLDDGRRLAVMDIAGAQWHFGRLGRLTRIDLRLQPGTALLASAFPIATLWLAHRLGAAGLTLALLTGQILMALVLDHFGWIGFAQKPINAARVAGVLMVLGGLVLVARH